MLECRFNPTISKLMLVLRCNPNIRLSCFARILMLILRSNPFGLQTFASQSFAWSAKGIGPQVKVGLWFASKSFGRPTFSFFLFSFFWEVFSGQSLGRSLLFATLRVVHWDWPSKVYTPSPWSFTLSLRSSVHWTWSVFLPPESSFLLEKVLSLRSLVVQLSSQAQIASLDLKLKVITWLFLVAPFGRWITMWYSSSPSYLLILLICTIRACPRAYWWGKSPKYRKKKIITVLLAPKRGVLKIWA